MLFAFRQFLLPRGQPYPGGPHLIVQFGSLGVLLCLAAIEILLPLVEQLCELPPLYAQMRQKLRGLQALDRRWAASAGRAIGAAV